MGRVQFWWSGQGINASTINTVVLHFPLCFHQLAPRSPVWESDPEGGGNDEGTELPDKDRGQQWASGLAWIFFLLFLHPASVELKKTELYEDSMQLAFSKEKFGLSSLFRIRLRGCKESHSFC